MIYTDRSPDHAPTTAQGGAQPPTATRFTPGQLIIKRPRDLEPGDAISVTFAGWGSLITRVLETPRLRVAGNGTDLVDVMTEDPVCGTYTQPFRADADIVVYPASRLGEWL